MKKRTLGSNAFFNNDFRRGSEQVRMQNIKQLEEQNKDIFEEDEEDLT